MRAVLSVALLAVLAVTMLAVGNTPARADSSAVIDFEGLAEGSIVGSLSSGSGISGDPVAGTVEAWGFNPAFPGLNSLMIFDATCTGGCTGEDPDLFKPALGNVAIITEDHDASDPDDAVLPGSRFEFDFSGFGPGKVTVNSLNVMDVEDDEGGAIVVLWSGGFLGTILGVVPIPFTGDNGLATVPIGIADVDYMSLTLNGSGAIDNIDLTVPGIDAQIDIEKYTQVVEEPVPGDTCETVGKPVVLTMVYTGDGPDASSHSQPADKAKVTGDPNDAASVRIIATDKSNPNDSKAKTWFDGTVALGASFDIDAATAGASRLSSNTFVFVLDGANNVLQTVQFHTSCSQPLNLGDQFGSVLLTGWVGQNGQATLPVGPPAGLGEDADTPTGPIAQVGDKIVWNYVVTNPGDTQLADVMVTDDNGTPGDTGDDFAPDPVLAGAFNVGDTDMDGRLDPGEEWLYMAMGIAQAGQYGNLSHVVGTPVDENGGVVGDDVWDEDPSHYLAELPQGDQCETAGKPVLLTMVYTGDGPDATSHSQDAGKVNVSGDPNDAASVRIIATDKSDPNNSKAKIWFDGTVALGASFDINAATGGASRLSSNTFVFVLDSGGTVLQSVQFHTSCSQPLSLGDQFGSVKVAGYVGEN